MIKNGVPGEYTDALLDDDYMERLLKHTDKIQAKRRKAMDRYVLLNKALLLSLIVWSVVGVAIGLFKAELQPPVDWKMHVNLQDVDLVLMVDASNHLRATSGDQKRIVEGITKTLFHAMVNLRNETEARARAMVEEAKAKYRMEHRAALQRLGFEDSGKEAFVSISGGFLRIATAMFNSDLAGRGLLHELSFNRDAAALLQGMTEDKYSTYSQWDEAMRACQALLQAAPPVEYPGRQAILEGRCQPWPKEEEDPECHEFSSQHDCPARYCEWQEVCRPKRPFCRRQFCVFVGDGEAMCKKRGGEPKQDGAPSTWKAKSDGLCAKFPDLCPDEGNRARYASTLEYPDELEDCSATANALAIREAELLGEDMYDAAKLNNLSDMNLVMVLNTATPSETQMFLRNPSFSKFVYDALGCQVKPQSVQISQSDGKTVTLDMLMPDKSSDTSCVRFIMESGVRQLQASSARLANLLHADLELNEVPNGSVNKCFRVFYLMPLLLLFFFGWTRIVKWYNALKLETQRRMGAKKRMIKVTKTIVEKEPELLEQRLPEFAEFEMADIKKLKKPIEVGMSVLLRSRLKGGYLRANVNSGVADGHGHAFEQIANWTFEADTGGPVKAGAPIKIRNANGELLVADADGAHFVTDEEGSALEPNFVAEPAEEGVEGIFLGDCIRIRCVGTGGYLRVSKDGDVDGAGEPSQAETQFTADAGGTPIVSGSVITLHSQSHQAFVHSTPQGEVHVGNTHCVGMCGDDWKYWLIEKQYSGNDKAGSSMVGRSANDVGQRSRTQSRAAADMLHEMGVSSRTLLREGDVVTLQGFNTQFLDIDERTRELHCGRQKLGGAPGAEGGAFAEPQEFLVHRIGVSKVTKHNQTIRKGAQICLKPMYSGEMSGTNDYLKSVDGGLEAKGALTDRDVVFTIDLAPVAQFIEPLAHELSDGDAFIRLAGGHRGDSVEAVSAAWTDEDTLRLMKGKAVLADADGNFATKEQAGDWVGIVKETADLFDACARARVQGATGIVVACDNPCSMDRLKFAAAEDAAAPCLPVVYVSDAVAGQLASRGASIGGCDLRVQQVTDLMRALGKLGASSGAKAGAAQAEVFEAAAAAMLGRSQAADRALARDAGAKSKGMSRKSFDHKVQEQKKKGAYVWAISANANYFWAGGAGNLNRAPVGTAKLREKDAIRYRGVFDEQAPRKRMSTVSVTHQDAAQVRALRLGNELGEVLTEEEALQVEEEALSSDSDFKITYKFEEIEVGIDEQPEDLDEEAFLDDEGAVVQAIGVPKSKFWVVGLGLFTFTALLLLGAYLVFLQMQEEPPMESPTPIGYDDSVGRVNFVPGTGAGAYANFLGFPPPQGYRGAASTASMAEAAAWRIGEEYSRRLSELASRAGRTAAS